MWGLRGLGLRKCYLKRFGGLWFRGFRGLEVEVGLGSATCSVSEV